MPPQRCEEDASDLRVRSRPPSSTTNLLDARLVKEKAARTPCWRDWCLHVARITRQFTHATKRTGPVTSAVERASGPPARSLSHMAVNSVMQPVINDALAVSMHTDQA